jgi:hypothetical protein
VALSGCLWSLSGVSLFSCWLLCVKKEKKNILDKVGTLIQYDFSTGVKMTGTMDSEKSKRKK